MDQLDTLCVLKEKFEQDALQVSLMPTLSLEQSIEGKALSKQYYTLQNQIAYPCKFFLLLWKIIDALFFSASRREADRLFKEVLNRRDKADATRNALSAMQRNKFLFSLPTNIERNSIKGDYDLIVNDYARAKSLFGDSEIEVLF
jgi:hypothetical protein